MRGALFAFAMLISVAAFGSTCTKREYAQYKDSVRTRQGQMGAAQLYCLNQKLADIERTFPARTREAQAEHLQNAADCDTETAKILDALSSVKASAALKHITEGCQDGKR